MNNIYILIIPILILLINFKETFNQNIYKIKNLDDQDLDKISEKFIEKIKTDTNITNHLDSIKWSPENVTKYNNSSISSKYLDKDCSALDDKEGNTLELNNLNILVNGDFDNDPFIIHGPMECNTNVLSIQDTKNYYYRWDIFNRSKIND